MALVRSWCGGRGRDGLVVSPEGLFWGAWEPGTTIGQMVPVWIVINLPYILCEYDEERDVNRKVRDLFVPCSAESSFLVVSGPMSHR